MRSRKKWLKSDKSGTVLAEENGFKNQVKLIVNEFYT